MSSRKLPAYVGAVGTLLASFACAAAYANPLPNPPDYNEVQVHGGLIFLCELVPLVLETAILARLFKLRWQAVFPVALLANTVSLLFSLTFQPTLDWIVETTSSLPFSFLLTYLLVAVAIETPIYWAFLARRAATGWRTLGILALANVISYPVFFIVFMGLAIRVVHVHFAGN